MATATPTNDLSILSPSSAREQFSGESVARRSARSSYLSQSSAKSAEADLERMYADQQANFDAYYAPLIDELEKEASSTEIMDNARRDSDRLDSTTRAQVDRSISRGGETLTAAQQRGLDRTIDSSISKGEATLLNVGRTQQRAYTEGVDTDLMNIGTALQNNSVDSLATISANQTARELEYENAKGGLMSNILGTVGAIGGAVVGGPVGAGIGGAIGTTIGGTM